jgi:type II secretory pathway pseudopilin PulG
MSLKSMRNKIQFSISQKGMTIIEVAIGIGLTLILGGALVSMGVLAIRASNSARMRAMALRYAEEGIEVVKRKRDEVSTTDLSSLFSWCNVGVGESSTACFVNEDSELVTEATDGGPADITPLKERIVTLTDDSDPPGGSNRLKVRVEVTWQEGTLEKSATLETYLTAWSG